MMNAFSDHEVEVLERYRNGDVLLDRHRNTVYNFSSIGLANLGYTIEDGVPKETASLTDLGISELKIARLSRSPFKLIRAICSYSME